MNLSFENKTALATDAGSGIDLMTVRAFAEAGAAVALVDVGEDTVRPGQKNSSPPVRRLPSAAMSLTRLKWQRWSTVFTFGRLDAADNNVGVQSPCRGNC